MSNLGPRRKRLHRPACLQAAVKWRASYGGKDIARGYARWFGVDLVCALTELRMLGVAIDAEYEQQLRHAIAARGAARAAKLVERSRPPRAGSWNDRWLFPCANRFAPR